MNVRKLQSDPSQQSPASPSRPATGRRAAIALSCWLLSSFGVYMSLMTMSWHSISMLLIKPLSVVIQSQFFYLGIGIAYAWTALAAMTTGWVINKPVALHWPVFGGIVGLVCSAYFSMFIMMYLPCAILGMYLCYFHLVEDSSIEQNAA